jgi:NADH-quinone oxidoreductase subunit M
MLPLIIAIPLIAAIALFRVPSESKNWIRNISIGASGLVLLLALGVFLGFDSSNPAMQFVHECSWVSILNIKFQLGVDGVSVLMVLLTALLSCASIFYYLTSTKNVSIAFLALMLVLEAGTLGVFMALDTVLFYVFWEVMLIPAYFLIGIWGEGNRIYATTKFVLYTLVGSLLMLVAIIGVTIVHYEATHILTFDIQTLIHTDIPKEDQIWMFVCFFLAFAIKVPIFPFHSWLPHAYGSCPIPALVVLTGAMSKTGAYGLIRFCLPLFPEAVEIMGFVIAGMAVTGMVYGAWIAIAQTDIKSLVAYSSISHLGFIVLGIFALNGEGLEGSVLQMFNHGIIAAALFFIVDIIEKKIGSRDLAQMRGLKGKMPALYGIFMLVTMAALGLPGLNGFVGEFLILVGVWTSSSMSGLGAIYVLMGGLTITFAAIYMLFFFQGAMQEQNEKLPADLNDIDRNHYALLIPACVLIVFIGLFPKPFVDKISPSAEYILTVEKTVKTSSGSDSSDHH